MFYVVLRDDLGAGQVGAQTAHVTAAFAGAHPGVLGGWHDGGGSVAVLAAPGDALPRLRDAFSLAGVPTASFREPDLGDVVTAVAVACERAHPLVRRNLRRLPLVGTKAISPPCPSGSGVSF